MASGLSGFRQSGPPGFFKLNTDQSKEVFIPLELAQMTRTVVHSNPKDYTKSAVCTYEKDELCYACQKGTFQWVGKVKIFIPVVENGKLNIMTQGTGVNSLLWPLADLFQTTGTSVGWFELSRTGAGKRSKYMAKSIDKSPPLQYNKRVDLSNHLHYVDYKDQETYYS